MAFPVIQTADTQSGVVTSNSNAWTITYPTNIAANDLLIFFVSCDGSPGGFTDDAGLTGIVINNTGANTWSCRAKIAAGTETGTFTLTLDGGASEQGGWRMFRVTNYFGDPTLSLNIFGQQTITGSPSANPDPPNNAPGWGAIDILWFASCGVDTSRTISVYPLADNNTADVSGGAGGATLGLCTTNSAVSSLNPGTFTISTSDDWVAGTVAVRPAAAAAARVFDSQQGSLRDDPFSLQVITSAAVARSTVW